MKLAIKHSAYYTAAASAAMIFGSGDSNRWYVSAQETDNISGPHTVHAGEHYADCTGFFGCLGGNNWGNNGQTAWYVKVTFPPSAASYSDNTCFSNTVEYYDWNKLWGKARCGYSHSHQQDSDRFVWRRLQDLHTSNPNCGGRADCTGIQLGTYSYDAGTTPYPNENWRLSRTFSTIVQPDVAYILGMESFADGSVLHSLYAGDWTLLETKTNEHNNLCTNYEQGSVLGLYFGGTCTAPEGITVVYEAMVDGPPDDGTSGPSVSPTKSPSQGPSRMPSSSPVGPTRSPTAFPTRSPSQTPSKAPCNNDGVCGPGETCGNCSGDCASKTNGNPNSQYCCNGDLLGCGNSNCACSSAPTPTPPTSTPPSCVASGSKCSGGNVCCSGTCPSSNPKKCP